MIKERGMAMVRKSSLLSVLLSAQVAAVAFMPMASAEVVGASDSQNINLTIYNQNFGLVKDVREIELKDGINYLRFEDVAAKIDPTTVSFTSLTAPNSVAVREQNYQYDLLNPTTILSKSVGKNVKFRQYLPGGGVKEVSGVLLNPPVVAVTDVNGNSSVTASGLAIKTADGVVLNPEGEAELAELPGGLVSKPSLLWKLEADKAGKHKAEIAYQTSDMNWRCDYVAVVNADDTEADLTSWVTLDNKSGASYKNASLKLIAGDVHRVTQHAPTVARGMMMMAAPAQAQFQEQSFAEYHLYALQNKTDVNDNETKQLSLFNASKVGSVKQFVFEPEQSGLYGLGIQRDASKVNVKLEIANTEANKLGMAMPKGKVRVYKKDKDGALQFIGEDMIDHTPRDEKMRLYLGDAFDIVAERKQMNQQNPSDRVQRQSFEISIRNHKDTDVTVTSVEHANGQWKILSSSQPYTKKDARTFEFAVKVPARGETKVDYEIETRW